LNFGRFGSGLGYGFVDCCFSTSKKRLQMNPDIAMVTAIIIILAPAIIIVFSGRKNK